MSFVITQRPIQSISGEVSNWNAAGNPVVYKGVRQDNVWGTLNSNSGFARVFITGDHTAEFTIGDDVLIVSNDGVYNTIGKVTVIALPAGNTSITTDIPFVSSTITGGYINNLTTRKLYRLEVNLYDLNDVKLNASSFTYSPKSDGTLSFDVSWVKNFMSPNNDIALITPDVVEDANVYKGFYLGYKEVWTGSAESEVLDNSNPVYAVYGAMQIPSQYGGNLYNYTVWETPPATLPKFLTKLDTLVMWRGWPFAVDFIVGEDFSGDLEVKVPLTIYSSPTDAGLYSAVLTGLEPEWIRLANQSGDYVSEEKTIELRDACKNPVMLMARNSLGGVLQWLFSYSQEYTFDYGDGRKAKRLVLSVTGLTLNEWEALQDFITLGEVYKNNIVEFTVSTNKTSTRIGQQVYVVNADGSKIGVIVIPTANTTLTKQVKHTFQIEIEYPEVFSV